MARKVTKKKSNERASLLANEKHIGYEILDWSDVEDIEDAMRHNLSRYAAMNDWKDAVKWGSDWVKKNRPKDLSYFKTGSDKGYCNTTIGGVAKMFNDGAPFGEHRVKWLNDKIDEIVERGKNIKSVQKEIIKEKEDNKPDYDVVFDSLVSQIEDEVDNFDGSFGFSAYTFLTEQKATKPMAGKIASFYRPLLTELNELIEEKTKDLVEAYSHSFKLVRERKAYRDFIQGIIEDCEKYSSTPVAKPKPNKPKRKKVVAPSKAVSRMKYLESWDDFNIKSAKPEKLLGAKLAYLYNTKTDQIIVAESDTGFDVKGTTINNLNPNKSSVRKVRKPEQFFEDFKETTRARQKIIIEDLTTKPYEFKGRTSDTILILKVYK